MKPSVRKILRLDALKSAAHNPPNRVAEKNLKALVDSIELIGLLHPLTVTAGGVIIDGHRRAASCRLLGWEEVECNVVDKDPDEVYASVNVTPRKLSGNDALGVWLTNPRAVPVTTHERIGKIANTIGLPLLRRIYEAGLSSRVYSTAVRIGRYCEDTSPETVKATVEWLLEFAVIGQVMKAMEAGESPALILKAVRAKKPVKMKLTMAG